MLCKWTQIISLYLRQMTILVSNISRQNGRILTKYISNGQCSASRLKLEERIIVKVESLKVSCFVLTLSVLFLVKLCQKSKVRTMWKAAVKEISRLSLLLILNLESLEIIYLEHNLDGNFRDEATLAAESV